MKRIARWLKHRLLDAVEWIYDNKPDGELMTMEDYANLAKLDALRKDTK